MLPTGSIPNAVHLGPTFTGWECEKCGIVDADEVVVINDHEAWHVGWGTCDGECHPIEILIHDPRAMANEGIRSLHALASEVLRLRTALAKIAEAQTTPLQYRRWAQKALRGDTLDNA